MTHHTSRLTDNGLRFLIVIIIFLAFVLRLWQLGDMPPGWRDDELINSLVISQKVLDGNLAVYYADASGHEALYHALNAVMLGLFGANWLGIRLLSAFLGTLTVPLTYQMGRKLFGPTVGLVAAAGLTFSFWSLMYSRIGLRHVLLPLLTLAAFVFFWRGLRIRDWRLENRFTIYSSRSGRDQRHLRFTIYGTAALFMALGFYTYFASRGVPLILLAFMGYVWLVRRPLFRRHWRGWLVMFVLAALLTLPLLVSLRQQPESEARVAELAVPLTEARQGNFAPLQEHVIRTLNMFHNDGDDEWLYNIPFRPVFGPVGAVFLWTGVLLAAYEAVWPIIRNAYCVIRGRPYVVRRTQYALPSAFLLLWWLAGISPGFISVPAASLGHTILAQPATYILAALPLGRLVTVFDQRSTVKGQRFVLGVLTLVLVGSVAARDLPDYFVNWPQRGMVRFLYRADIADLADYVNENPEMTDFGVTGLLAGPWDKVALNIDLEEETAIRPRWYNPERALLLQPALSFSGYPQVSFAYEASYNPVTPSVRAGAYALTQVEKTLSPDEPVCFANGLCWQTAVYDPKAQILELGWRVERELDLPPMPLISNPPPPGVYAGPRLLVFGQLWDAQGNFIAGDDGLWVDPYTLHPGDVFIQQHRPQAPPGAEPTTAVFGLYDPLTGARILTEDGRDHLRLEIGE